MTTPRRTRLIRPHGPAHRPATPDERTTRTTDTGPVHNSANTGSGRDTQLLAPGPSARTRYRRHGWPSRMRPWVRVLAVLAPLLAVLAGLALSASAAHGTPHTPAAAAPGLAQPPLPLPPQPACGPGAPDPACTLPTAPAPAPTGLPSATLVPPPTPPPSCFPGALMPECGGLGSTTPPTTAPPSCTGPNCIPQPVPSGPGGPGTAPAPGTGSGEQADKCGITDPVACVTEGIESFFRGVVTDALNPLLDLLGKTLLTTPDPGSLPGLGQLWTGSWQIMLAVYAILVTVAGLLLMGYGTLQNRYTAKEIAPRVAAGFLAGTLSLFAATKGIEFANALAQAVMGEGVSPQAAAKTLTDMLLKSLGGSFWVILIGLALVVMVVILLVTFVVRVLATVLLIGAAPIALMCHALPQTDGIAQRWWKAFAGVLGIQVGQSMVLVAALRTVFTPNGLATVLGQAGSGVVNVLMCLALMWVLIMIPFWCLRPMHGGGRSMLGSLVRGAIAYKAMGLLRGAGSRGKSGRPRAHRDNGGGGGGGGGDAAADPPSTRSGQYMLPMRVRRTRPAPRRSPRLGGLPGTARTDRRPGPGQLSLFTASGSGDEQTMAVNPRALPPDDLPGALPRDQLGLPITTRRDPDRTGRRSLADDLADRPARTPPAAQPGLLTADGRINRNARPPAQLPRALLAPGAGMLPIHLRPAPPRTPRRTLADDLADPAPPGPPQTGPGLITPSGRINRAARAPRRPARDAYTGNRPLASGQYPLPLGVRRQPKPTPPPAATGTDASPSPKRRAGTQLPLPLDLPARRAPKKK
ncbi:hypothetical protein [Amycolatopsis rubida]|uniref:Uncharacterized protein n=1 Tax=Amycolatopsis rubida TaxID=112413 RepID=A0A1I5DYY7_9PSEU|nr:hypothetical protein [Amycolatopsis rubida]SFO04419.1 hypothetical protein SAMN05421854_101416 [Amycolatopsis rubida]